MKPINCPRCGSLHYRTDRLLCTNCVLAQRDAARVRHGAELPHGNPDAILNRFGENWQRKGRPDFGHRLSDGFAMMGGAE